MKNEIIETMRAEAPLNWSKAQEIAEKFDIKPRAVVASATRNGIEYEKKKRVSKSGAPIVRKTDLVAKLESLTGEKLEGLEKSSKEPLETMLNYIESLQS
jgi:hypothetical protein